MAEAPYIYYKFLGINSFITTLNDSGTEYTLFDENYESLFEKYDGILNSEDTLKTGVLSREGQYVFFTEVGIKITKSYSSFFVFIFDRHPANVDIEFIIEGLESLVHENVDKIDPSDIADKLNSGNEGGHLIN